MKMGCKWATLPTHVRKMVEEAVAACLHAMNEQEVSYTVYSFGIMAAPWADLPADVRERMEETAVARFPRSVPQGVANIVYGFSLMGLKWRNHSAAYRAAAYACIVKVCAPTQRLRLFFRSTLTHSTLVAELWERADAARGRPGGHGPVGSLRLPDAAAAAGVDQAAGRGQRGVLAGRGGRQLAGVPAGRAARAEGRRAAAGRRLVHPGACVQPSPALVPSHSPTFHACLIGMGRSCRTPSTASASCSPA